MLALGNPLRGDDGAGPAVIALLVDRDDLPGHVELLDGGTPGLETALLLEGVDRAIVVDAAGMRKMPGEWTRFNYDQALFTAGDLASRGTLHNAGLAEALRLGDALGILPDDIVIYGIQPAEVGWSPGLSEPVQKAVEIVAEEILQELQKQNGIT